MTFQKLGAKILHVKHISHCCVLLLKNSIWHFSSSRISVIHAQQELGRTENYRVLWSLWRSLKRNQFTSTSHLGEGLAENSHTNPPLLGAVFRRVIAILKFPGNCFFFYFVFFITLFIKFHTALSPIFLRIQIQLIQLLVG